MAAREDILEKVRKSRQEAERRIQQNNQRSAQEQAASWKNYEKSVSAETRSEASYMGKYSSSSRAGSTVADYAEKRRKLTSWYKGDTPSAAETLARITQIGQTDDAKGRAAYDLFEQERATPGSPFYNPYDTATSQKQTKTTLANTQKAMNEWAALADELTYWAGRTDLNLSDDDILARVDWDNYKTLQKMDEGRLSGSPLELLAPVGYSEDAMRGVLWAARNPESSTGDAMMDAVQSAMGRGKTYVRDDIRAAQLDPSSQSYNPYAVSGTMLDLERKYGTAGFDADWLEQNMGMRGNTDYAKVYNAEQFTAEAEAELEEFNRILEEELTARPTQDVDKLVSYLFDEGNFKALAKLDESLKSGKLLDTTRAIHYDRQAIEQGVREYVALSQARANAPKDPEAMAASVEAEKAAVVKEKGMLSEKDTIPQSRTNKTETVFDIDVSKAFQDALVWAGTSMPHRSKSGDLKAWENQYDYVENAKDNQELSAPNRLIGRYADWTDEQKEAGQDYIYASRGGYTVDNEVLALKEAGLTDEQVNSFRSEVSEALASADYTDDHSYAWFDPTEEVPAKNVAEERNTTRDLQLLIESGNYEEAAKVQYNAVSRMLESSDEEAALEVLHSVDSQKSAATLLSLAINGGMMGKVNDPQVKEQLRIYEKYAKEALAIEDEPLNGFIEKLDSLLNMNGALVKAQNNDGLGLNTTLQLIFDSTMTRGAQFVDDLIGSALIAVGSAVGSEKLTTTGESIATDMDSTAAHYQQLVRDNGTPLEIMAVQYGSEIAHQLQLGSVASGLMQFSNAKLGESLKFLQRMISAAPFAAEAGAGEFFETYEETKDPLLSAGTGLAGYAVTSLMSQWDGLLRNIEANGMPYIPEVVEKLSSVPGSGALAGATRWGKGFLMWLGNLGKTAVNEAVQEPAENVATTFVTDLIKGKNPLDRDWGEYGRELIAEGVGAAILSLGSSVSTMPTYARSVIVAESQLGKSELNASDVQAFVDALKQDMSDPQIVEEAQRRATDIAVEARTGELLAQGGLPETDNSAVDAAQKKADEAQARAAETAAELESATARVGSANEQFRANPADDSAKNRLSAALKEEQSAQKANDQAVTDAQAAQAELEEAQASVQAQSDAVMGAVRAQAEAEVEGAVSVSRDERAAANEVQRESDNAAVIDADNFISTQLKGYNLTDEDRQRVTEMIRSRTPLKGADNREGSGSRVKFITGMQKKFGVKITVRDTTEGGQYLRYNGMYDPKTDSIVIDSKATQSDVIYGVLLHELTHKAERSEVYGEFAKSILALKYGEDTQKLEADIRAKQLSYDARLKKMAERDASVEVTPLTRDQAQREIVADLTREILYGDEASIQKLCAEQPSVAQRILEAIRNFIDRLRGVNDPAIDQLNKTRDLFEKALGTTNNAEKKNLATPRPVQADLFTPEAVRGTVPKDSIPERHESVKQYSLPSDDVLSEMVDSYLSRGAEPEQPKRPQGERQFVRQTMPNTEAVPEWIWREFQQNPDELNYDIDSNREQVERGWRRIQENGYDAELNRLMETDTFGKDDTAQANLMMAMALREDDPATFMALASKYNKEGTKAGQTLQARKLFTRMSPTGARIWMAGKLEGELGDFIRRHRPIKTKVDQKARQIADSIRELDSTDLVKRLTAGDEVTLDNQNNRFGVPINAQQQALIEQYGLGDVKRPGIFYNRATTEQRMLEAILATPNPLEMTGNGLNLIQRLEYMKEGAAVVTNADLNYIGSMLSEFVARGGEEGGREADVAVARAYEAFGNITPATVGEKARTWRYMAMLTSVPSAIRNIIGNATQNTVNAASHGIAVELDKIVSKYTGARTTEHLSASERVAGWRGFVEETKNTFRDYFVDKVVTQRGEAKYSTSQKGRVYQSTAVEAIRNVEGFLMSFGDRNVWRKAYLNSMAEQQKLADQNLLFNEDGTTRTHEQMLDQAEADANYATFTEDNQVSNILSQLKRVPGIGHVVELEMPFTGVHANITRRMIQYSPIGLTTTLLKNAYGAATGKTFDQQAFVQGVSRGLTGTALFGVGMLLAQMGAIKMGTGEEEDKKKYGLQTAMGQQYSPFIYNPLTDEYVSLSVFSPAASALTMGGAAWMDFQNDEDAIQALQNAAFGSIDQIFDASYMSGLSDLFGGYGSFGENLRDTLLSSAISQNVPAILSQLANTVDPYVRNTKDKNSLMQALKSGLINKIPFLRQQLLPEKVDVTGQTFRTKEGLRNFYDPFTTTDARQEPVVDELFRLSEALGSSSMLPSDALSGTKNSITLNKQTVVLDGEGKEAYQKRYGELWLEGGVTIDKKGKRKTVEGVRELMASVRYQRMSDEEKADAIADILAAAMTGAKMEAIQKYGSDAEKE